MEVVKLRLFAEAYYKNSPREVQQHANKFFQDMDTNRDGYVTLAEFTEFLHQNGYNWVNPQMFAQLDANGDGRLDLWEVLTFYYILKTRCVWCDGCRAPLHELYFTCVKCFDAGKNTYDLCAECYCRRGTSGHQHTQLVDSYVLLRSKRGISGMNVNMAVVQAQSQPIRPNRWFRALETAVMVGNLAGTASNFFGCSIM